MDYTGFINNGIDSLKHLWYERIVIVCGSYNELFILNSFICTDSKRVATRRFGKYSKAVTDKPL